jgi:hypothetical protein
MVWILSCLPWFLGAGDFEMWLLDGVGVWLRRKHRLDYHKPECLYSDV